MSFHHHAIVKRQLISYLSVFLHDNSLSLLFQVFVLFSAFVTCSHILLNLNTNWYLAIKNQLNVQYTVFRHVRLDQQASPHLFFFFLMISSRDEL